MSALSTANELIRQLRGQNVHSPAFLRVAEALESIAGVFADDAVSVQKRANLINNIIAGYKAVQVNNPHYNADMASPPTITQVGGSSTISSAVVTLAASGSALLPAPFQYNGGGFAYASTVFVRFPAATLFSSGGNVGGGQNATVWRVAFITDAPIVDIGVLGGGNLYRFIVDNAYVSSTATNVSSGGTQYVKLDFTSAGGTKKRVIQLEGRQAGGFLSVAVGQGYKIYKAASPARIIVQGDSVTGATAGVTYDGDGVVRVMGDYLGVNDTWLSGIGGTGYTSNNGGSAYTMLQRLTDVTNNAPDIVILSAGTNDADDSAFQPAVLSHLQAIRAALPYAIIMVTGIWPGAQNLSAALLSRENKAAAAVTTMNDSYCKFIKIATDDMPWVTGTGKVGSTTGVGNGDIVNSSDGTHPSDYGAKYLGQQLAEAVIRTLITMR